MQRAFRQPSEPASARRSAQAPAQASAADGQADQRPASAAQRRLFDGIHSGALMTAQRERIDAFTGGTAQRRAALRSPPPAKPDEDGKKPMGGGKEPDAPEAAAGRYPADAMKLFKGNMDTMRSTSSKYPHLSIVFEHNGDGTVCIGQHSHWSLDANTNRDVDIATGTYVGGPPGPPYPTAAALLAAVTKARGKLERAAEKAEKQRVKNVATKKLGGDQKKVNKSAAELRGKGTQYTGIPDGITDADYQSAAAEGWTTADLEAHLAGLKKTKDRNERVVQLVGDATAPRGPTPR